MIGQPEFNFEIDERAFRHLLSKADGQIIRKTRYIIPLREEVFEGAFAAALREAGAEGRPFIELDVFQGELKGLVVAEVEFPSEEAAVSFCPVEWFGKEVTGDRAYSNASLAVNGLPAGEGMSCP